MTSDGQTLWVLLADGRVRGFVGGAPAQLIAPAALPPLTAATAVTTSPVSPYLYVADGAQGRILRIRKADGQDRPGAPGGGWRATDHADAEPDRR